jgi:hypothetical protein
VPNKERELYNQRFRKPGMMGRGESEQSPTSSISLATKISARVRLEQETKRASSRITPSDGDEATFQVG